MTQVDNAKLLENRENGNAVQAAINERRKIVIEEFHYNSNKISELARIISIGLAGQYLLFSVSTAPFAKMIMEHYRWPVALLSVAGVAILVMEYIQYVLGLKLVDSASDVADDPSLGELYPDSSTKRWAFRIFKSKQYLTFASALAYVILLGITVLNP
jgi:hypothetical protein